MSHHVANLFKLNTFVQNVDFQKISLPELRTHYTRIKSLQSNKKLLDLLPDKGEKYLTRLQNIEDVIRKRCSKLEQEQIDVEINKSKVPDDNLNDLLNKFEKILIERKHNEYSEDSKVKKIESENLESNKNVGKICDDMEKTILVKNEMDVNGPTEKNPIVTNSTIKTEHINYFARKATVGDKINEKERLKQVKQRILENMKKSNKYPTAKSIPLNECFILMKEHEKRVQEFQIQQAANKLLEGKSTKFDYDFVQKANKSNLRYRDHKNEFDEESTLFDSDSDEDDYFNDYYDDDDEEGMADKIDRLHFNETAKSKFKLNDDL